MLRIFFIIVLANFSLGNIRTKRFCNSLHSASCVDVSSSYGDCSLLKKKCCCRDETPICQYSHDDCHGHIPIIGSTLTNHLKDVIDHVPVLGRELTTELVKVLKEVPMLERVVKAPVLEFRKYNFPIVRNRIVPVIQKCVHNIPIIKPCFRADESLVLRRVPICETRVRPVLRCVIHHIPVRKTIICPQETSLPICQRRCCLHKRILFPHSDTHCLSHPSHSLTLSICPQETSLPICQRRCCLHKKLHFPLSDTHCLSHPSHSLSSLSLPLSLPISPLLNLLPSLIAPITQTSSLSQPCYS